MRKVGRKFPLFIGTLIVSLILAVTNLFTLPTYTGRFTEAPVIVEAATDYYAGIDTSLSGSAFRSEVAKLITSTHHTNTTYDGLRNVYPYSDKDPDVSGNILWFYSGTSFRFTGSFNDGTNREHVWPKNAGKAFPASSECGSDAHHLRPANANLNSSRSNNNFGEVSETNGNIVKENGKTSYASLCYQASSTFYPGKGYRGATARILMYVQTRWGDKFNLQFVLGKGSNKTIGDIEDLLKWHYLEPPTEAEYVRNEYVYSIQGNRNPFIDHPEYATKIYCYDGQSYNKTLQNVAKTYDKYSEEQPLLATDVTITPEEKECTVDDVFTLSVTASPKDAVCDFNYTSDDTTVATVNQNGKVTAVGQGLATITVKETRSGITKTVLVLVNDKISSDVTEFSTKVLMVKAKRGQSNVYAAILDALNVYNAFDDQEKLAVYDDYTKLVKEIEIYNSATDVVNSSADKAFENAWTALKPDDKEGEQK